MTSWVQVQIICEDRLKTLAKNKKEGMFKDLKILESSIQANEDLRKLAIIEQGKKYEGRYTKS